MSPIVIFDETRGNMSYEEEIKIQNAQSSTIKARSETKADSSRVLKAR
jgi:hypothetical protein